MQTPTPSAAISVAPSATPNPAPTSTVSPTYMLGGLFILWAVVLLVIKLKWRKK